MICLLLGVPYSDHQFFQRDTLIMLSLTASVQERGAASAALFSYLSELAACKEGDREDDLIRRD